MKKIIALMILVIYCDFLFGNSFEEMKEIMKAQKIYGCTKSRSTQQRNAEYEFKQNPIKYYKRRSLAYCLGYTSKEDIVVKSGCTSKGLPKEIKNFAHIDNMVEFFSNEAIGELKAYIDRYFDIHKMEQKGSVNMCFDWIYDSKEYQDEVVRIVKKYCKHCK
mgnify:CR=1 FL=1